MNNKMSVHEHEIGRDRVISTANQSVSNEKLHKRKMEISSRLLVFFNWVREQDTYKRTLKL